jgi:hypothetical protein
MQPVSMRCPEDAETTETRQIIVGLVSLPEQTFA